MAQHDYDINSSDSISGLQFRADVNAVLSAIKSSNSGATAPTTYIAGTLWLDTSTTPHILKKRNTANTGWDTIRIEDALGTAIASATTTTVGTYSGGNTVHITGVTTITSLGVSTTGTTRTLIFDGALTITHNATSLILLGGADILTVAGSVAKFVCEDGALGYWRCTAISHSAVSMAELLYISTLTSNAQTQLNAKAPLASPTLTGVPAAPTASLGTNTTQIATTAFVLANAGASKQLQPITASVAANALTVTLNATSLDFRSSTLGDGTVNTRTVASPISMTVSSGSTLGTVSATASRLVLIAIDNAGTVELAIANLAGGNNLDETTLLSTTAEGGAGAADSASVIYSTSARTNVPFRVVGFIDITEATAGAWATAPSTIQGIGGQALAAMSSIGYGQTWQNVKASRAVATTYTNSTGKPIMVIITLYSSSVNGLFTFTLNGNTYNVSRITNNLDILSFSIIIPNGNTYAATITAAATIENWLELR